MDCFIDVVLSIPRGHYLEKGQGKRFLVNKKRAYLSTPTFIKNVGSCTSETVQRLKCCATAWQPEFDPQTRGRRGQQFLKATWSGKREPTPKRYSSDPLDTTQNAHMSHTSYTCTQSDNDEGNNDDRMLSPFNATLIKNITRELVFFCTVHNSHHG